LREGIKPERPLRKIPQTFPERRGGPFVFSACNDDRRKDMKKIFYALAALATVAIAAPTIASAEDFGFRVGPDHSYYYGDRDYRGPGVEFYGRDRGYHRGWYQDRGDRVIIRRHHDRDWDD
jgi:hypothetical protein